MTRSPVSHLIVIRTDQCVRGIDRSEGAGPSTRPRGYAALNVVAFSEGKAAEHEKHGCIKEFSYAGDNAVRGTALDSGHGGRADP